MLELRTWNVLHRIHAENWREPAITAHPDEPTRIARVAKALAAISTPTVVCLQEVSGDQLAALRSALPDAALFEMTYPRVPKLRDPAAPRVLDDAREHLVTLVFGDSRASANFVSAGAFATDPGKGWLAIELDGLVVVNTHVTYGERHAAQCARLLELAPPTTPCVILGDFNADRATCSGRLPGFAAAIPSEPALPTRPRASPSDRSQTIDHVFARGVTFTAARVEDGRGLSDHNPVVATIGDPPKRSSEDEDSKPANPDHVARADRRLAHVFVVDQRPVGRAEIDDGEGLSSSFDHAVESAHGRVIEPQMGVRHPADLHDVMIEGDDAILTRPFDAKLENAGAHRDPRRRRRWWRSEHGELRLQRRDTAAKLFELDDLSLEDRDPMTEGVAIVAVHVLEGTSGLRGS